MAIPGNWARRAFAHPLINHDRSGSTALRRRTAALRCGHQAFEPERSVNKLKERRIPFKLQNLKLIILIIISKGNRDSCRSPAALGCTFKCQHIGEFKSIQEHSKAFSNWQHPQKSSKRSNGDISQRASKDAPGALRSCIQISVNQATASMTLSHCLTAGDGECGEWEIRSFAVSPGAQGAKRPPECLTGQPFEIARKCFNLKVTR